MRHKPILLLIIAILISSTALIAGDCGDVNSSGTVNILDVSFLINYLYKGVPAPDCGIQIGKVTDIDGNIYRTVKIGDRWWIVENLQVTHYRNGVAIPNVTDDGTWSGLTTRTYCGFDNHINNVAIYGRLYNWYAVNDAQNIAAAGWHVPSDNEWQTLVDYLGGDVVAGGKMKEAETIHWSDPNNGANNESGITALGGGNRIYSGCYGTLGNDAHFWSSTLGGSGGALSRILNYNNLDVVRSTCSWRHGFSIRCVKD